MLNKIQIIIILVLIPIGVWYLYMGNQRVSLRDFFFSPTPIVHFDDLPVRVEIASTPEALKKGLSGRDDIGGRHKGMFFIFPETDYHGIWMLGMKFSIDIVWIDENLTVVDITRNISPDTYPRTFRTEKPIRYVLETEAQYVDLVGIRVGQKVRIPLEK